MAAACKERLTETKAMINKSTVGDHCYVMRAGRGLIFQKDAQCVFV
jgi:hypothetical protein